MNEVMYGKPVAQHIKQQVKQDVELLQTKQIKPCLAVILVGENPASLVYVNNKQKTCKELGIESKSIILPEDYGQENLLEMIHDLNEDPTVNGILCQLPLPAGYDEKTIIEAISPVKDVDAFHPINVGHIMIGDHLFLPCTPAGIMRCYLITILILPEKSVL